MSERNERRSIQEVRVVVLEAYESARERLSLRSGLLRGRRGQRRVAILRGGGGERFEACAFTSSEPYESEPFEFEACFCSAHDGAASSAASGRARHIGAGSSTRGGAN